MTRRSRIDFNACLVEGMVAIRGLLEGRFGEPNPAAINSLGFHHVEETPLKLPEDQMKGISYFERAYAAGSTDALVNIANQYSFLGQDDPSYWEKRKDVFERYYAEGGRFLS